MSSFNHSLLLVFYFLAVISLYLGFVSLRGGVRFIRYLAVSQTSSLSEFTPFVTVFFPLRGVDDGLVENINAVFSQDYADYEVVFISDREDDPAWAAVEAARHAFTGESGPAMQMVVAGPAVDSGQKVHNLTHAISFAHPNSEVFVFVDSDARPNSDWLRALVDAVHDESVGAATGYRWFVPQRAGFATHLRSVWNASIASALGANEKGNFCWGGATAIRRSIFDKIKVREHWRGVVSDDFALTRALQQAQLPIRFVPQCLTPSFEDCSLSELFEFSTRQLKITRTYAVHLWRSVLLGSVIFVFTFFGGLALIVFRAITHQSFALPLWLLLIIFLMGAMKSQLRLKAVSQVARLEPGWVAATAHITLWPIASALYLYNAIAAAVSRRITWRGITYELKSAHEVSIVRRER